MYLSIYKCVLSFAMLYRPLFSCLSVLNSNNLRSIGFNLRTKENLSLRNIEMSVNQSLGIEALKVRFVCT